MCFLVVTLIFSISCEKEEENTVKDIDGNAYHTVKIGSQEWMVENLKTTKYKDGAIIPLVSSDNTWAYLTTAAYCWYDNNEAYKQTYGALYNFLAVNTGRLCPAGWHVPTDEEWFTLENFIDSTVNDPELTGWRGTTYGKMLKATSRWNSNGNGTDDFGFSVLPGGGRRGGYGNFQAVGAYGYYWTSSLGDAP